MWCIITRRKPPVAPQPSEMAYIPSNHPAHLAPPPPPVAGQQMVTFGGYLLGSGNVTFSNIDPVLRNLVARCLAANPEDRPDSRLLLSHPTETDTNVVLA